MEPVVQLCLQRGFCFPSSELYGGLSGAYDYGPLGTPPPLNAATAAASLAHACSTRVSAQKDAF